MMLNVDSLIEKIEEKLQSNDLGFGEKLAYGTCLGWVGELVVMTNRPYLLSKSQAEE